MTYSPMQAMPRRRAIAAPTPEEVLADLGIDAALISSPADAESIDPRSTLVLIESSAVSRQLLRSCLDRCARLKAPVLLILDADSIEEIGNAADPDDFIVSPFSREELALRARRLVERAVDGMGEDVVRIGDLAINPTNYEVSVRGRRVDLRFKEYELLLLMASNPGRVYSREALLKQVWGYEYLGGTRTVDVHVRRLRSKIEDVDRSYIETIWNVGYRIRDSAEC